MKDLDSVIENMRVSFIRIYLSEAMPKGSIPYERQSFGLFLLRPYALSMKALADGIA
jgi:hypothetical protein